MSEIVRLVEFLRSTVPNGPNLLLGIDDDLRELIEEMGLTTDIFWSEGLQERLADGADNDDLRAGVLSALELWRENVIETLDTDFAIELRLANCKYRCRQPDYRRAG